jgi:formiminotetrahydrofolate cyclodeaminase
VPLQIAEWAAHALRIARALVPLLAKSGVGDAGAGASLLGACGRTAVQNCLINARTRLARSAQWRAPVESRARELRREIFALEAELEAAVEARA